MGLLVHAKKGEKGIITEMIPQKASEIRLAELGFRAGVQYVIVEEAPISRDPIVIELNEVRFAVRRSLLEGIKVKIYGE